MAQISHYFFVTKGEVGTFELKLYNFIMTKYILNAGGTTKDAEKTSKYYAEILKGLGKNPKILYCFFAEKRENWEEKYEKYVGHFESLVDKNTQPIFEMALPDKFEQQVKESDAVIIHGGDDHLVMYWLKQFDLSRMFNGKTVAVSSASSDALSKAFYAIDWRQCMDGLGILPIKFISHYKSDWGENDTRGPIDWENIYNELEGYKEDLPIHALEEGNFIVIEQ